MSASSAQPGQPGQPGSLRLRLPFAARRPVLACGAGLGGTFCLVEEDRADVFAYGATPDALRVEIARRERELGFKPEVIACDPHPSYASSRIALEIEGDRHVEVQHHHAHLAAVLAEHGETAAAAGAVFDLGGFGLDGTVWGGEILAGDLGPVERRGLLFPVRMPGGEVMVHERWRMACAWLAAATGEAAPGVPATLASAVGRERWQAVAEMARTGISSPLTTSAGRLLEAVGAITPVAAVGIAHADLEGDPETAYPLPLIEEGDAPLIMDARVTFRAALADLEAEVDPALVRLRFALALADAAAEGVLHVARRAGASVAVLAGDVFAAPLIRDCATAVLRDGGMRVLAPERLPAGDAAISFGQAAVAAWADREPRS